MSREQATLILPSLEDDESDFLPRIAGRILDGVGPDHCEFAQTRLSRLLGSYPSGFSGRSV